MKKRICLYIALTALYLLPGCKSAPETKDYTKPLPPGQLALRKIKNPEQIPDLTTACYNLAKMQTAINHSLNYLRKPSSKQFFPYGNINHARAVDSLEAFQDLISSGLRGPQLNDAIIEKFDVYESVGCDNMGTVLFTGYYTPILNGSLKKNERFKHPLYSKPDDLEKTETGQIIGRRTPSGQITAYPTRAELENSNILKGNELLWLQDPFEAYVAHVQGSAKIKLPDGKMITVGYAASNGQEYRSVAKKLVAEGRIPKSRLSLEAMINFFDENPNLLSQYLQYNPRFVFFRKSKGPPRGSINEPVTPMRTIATDKSVYPRACLAYLSTNLPRIIAEKVYIDPYQGFVLDQDTGGAIRAAGKCDVYMGVGKQAGSLAGHTYKEGKLYYLFLKPGYFQAEKPPLFPEKKPQL